MSTRKLRAMSFALAIATFFAAAGPVAAQNSADALPPHALKNSSSLYLREAADSAIRWQPWSEATFALARKLKRPMLIDIGAVWCHWCHVMDQTTYADAKVAALINADFVPVKVDTDERPDIDTYYQTAAQNFGVGGWPLTCFATADGAPIVIAGYLPPGAEEHRGMEWVLARVKEAYAEPKIDRLAHELASKVSAGAAGVAAKPGSLDQLRDGIENGVAAAFEEKGEGPNFYDFPAIRMLLARGFRGHPDSTAVAVARLKAIAAGGVFDQLGGGLHRYSVDGNWGVPHFEKMAYDQAMALRTYAEAYEATHDEEFARTARRIIAYINTTLLDPKTHTFYSHQDADAFAGDDGSYYTWTEDELRLLLKRRDLSIARMHFGFDSDATRAPDGRIVLRDATAPDDIARKLRMTTPEVAESIDRISRRMLEAREKRHAPQVDTTVLSDRNALMASAYIAAADALGDEQAKRVALEDIDFLGAHAREADGSFNHELANGAASVPGLAADQVYMMSALLDAYQTSGDPEYLKRAQSLGALVFDGFRDSATGMLKNRAPATPGTVLAQVPPLPQVLFDDPTPGIQAVAAEAFQTLAALNSSRDDATKADEFLRPATIRIGAIAGPNNGELGLALEDRAAGEAVVAIAGGAKDERAARLWRVALATFRPGKVVLRLTSVDKNARLPEPISAMYEAASKRDAPLAFVCAGAACAPPVADEAALVKTIRDFNVAGPKNGGLAAR